MKFFLFFACLAMISNSCLCQTATWYLRGSHVQNGTSLVLNPYDSLVLGCIAIPYYATPSTSTTAFVITKTRGLSSYTMTQASNGAKRKRRSGYDEDDEEEYGEREYPASYGEDVDREYPALFERRQKRSTANPVEFSPSPSGTILYDSVNGHRADYDHIIMSVSIPYPGRNLLRRGYIQMYIPVVRNTDSGTYFCNYVDGSETTSEGNPDTFAVSGSISVSVNTKISGLGSGSNQPSASKSYATYTLALLGASKIIL